MKKKQIEQIREESKTTIMPFGKFKDTPICEVPTDHLAWMLRTINNMPGWARRVIESEFKRRPDKVGHKTNNAVVNNRLKQIHVVRSIFERKIKIYSKNRDVVDAIRELYSDIRDAYIEGLMP